MHYKQNNKESKTYVQGLRPFGNTLPHGVKSILKRNGYNYSEIISKWNILVGRDISNYSYPQSKNNLLPLLVKIPLKQESAICQKKLLRHFPILNIGLRQKLSEESQNKINSFQNNQST